MNATGNPKARFKLFLASAFLLALLIGVGSVFYVYDPQKTAFYPKCPFYVVTGLLCPGCGSLRALHELSHAHLVAALRLNPLLVLVLLPAASWAALRIFIYQATGNKWPALFLKKEWCWVLLALVVIFGIARNLPVARKLFF